jgi:uncharacterized protein with HEPN domain
VRLSLSFRDARSHLGDILESINNVELFVGEMDFAAYCEDRKTKSAVERELQIITEAAIRLGDEAEILCPEQDWKGFRGMGNILRHAYHRIDDRIIWNTIKIDLPPLKEGVKRSLDSSPRKSDSS